MVNQKLSTDQIRQIVREAKNEGENLIGVLLRLQENSTYHYITQEAAEIVAEEWGITLSEVYEVITFYSMLNTKPKGKYIIEICKSGPCHVVKTPRVVKMFESALGIKMGETTKDFMFTLQYTNCVGACDIGPVAKIGEKVYGNLTEDKVKHIINSYREQELNEKFASVLSARFDKTYSDSVQNYVKNGGYEGLKKALSMQPLEIIEEVKKAKLNGRGGAGYPAGSKWEQLYNIEGETKYIVCNADEGEPGTFKDKLIMEHDPFSVIEGMTIAGYTFNSHDGYIYIRGEYPIAQRIIKNAIKSAKEAGYLGDNILGSGFSFDIHVVRGAGSYVCGENSTLLNSIEGKAGRPRMKPPHLAEVGLFGLPTLVNNVESLAAIPYIVANGGDKFASYGSENSGGTKLLCLSGNVLNRGVYEVPLGMSLKDIIYKLGGGVPEGRKLKFVHIGGSSGPCIPEEMLDTPYCYKALKSQGLALGSGAVLVVDDSNCIVDFLKCVIEFFVEESCGKCVPCRIGNVRLYEILSKFQDGTAVEQDIENMLTLARVMKVSSFCGLGQSAATALVTCLKYFRNEFEEHINGQCNAGVCTFSARKAIPARKAISV